MYQIDLKDPLFLPHVGCDIVFSLERGECLVLVGENGIGKTTLARRVFGILGEHRVCLLEQPPMDHFYDRTLKKFKTIFLQSLSDKISITRFNNLWQELGLLEKENRLLSQLSGGENQALKMVLGLVGHHSLIILDEPSQYLDTSRKDILRKHLEQLLTEGKSLLIIEHDLSWINEKWRVCRLINNDGTIVSENSWTI